MAAVSAVSPSCTSLTAQEADVGLGKERLITLLLVQRLSGASEQFIRVMGLQNVD